MLSIISILAYYNYNLSKGIPVLTITDDNGEVVQELEIPQYDGEVEVNPDGDSDGRPYYFFGCFRSSDGFLDTTGAGFYTEDSEYPVLNTGFHVFEAGLCNALYESSANPGFNLST